MTKHVEARFTVDRWDSIADSAQGAAMGEDGPPELAHAVIAKTYAGPSLEGSASGHVLTTRGERGASYVAQERIVGTLEGRTGSFVLEHHASMGEGFPTVMEARVVHGSGTGELAGLAGTGLVEHELLILDYDL